MAALSTPSYGALASIGGTALPLVSSPTVISTGVVIKALGSNTGNVYVGNDANVLTTTGFVLAPGDQYPFDSKWFSGWSPLSQASNADLATIYVIGDGSGQEVRFWWI